MRGRTLTPRSKPRCGCEWIQISDSFWICPHDAYGPAVHYAGALEQARIMLELAGGYEAALERQRLKRKRK